jgi:hypothetical protein
MSNQLPFSITVSTEDLDVDTADWLDYPDCEREEVLSDYLSDEFGFCVNSFFWDERFENQIIIIDITEIDWDLTD